MVRINRVHTGGGDKGETSLVDGSRVRKCELRLEVVGIIDELNSFLGVVRMELGRLPEVHPDGRVRTSVKRAGHLGGEAVSRVQQELFDIGGECSCPPGSIPEKVTLVGSGQPDRLVSEMDGWLEDLEPLESFILPTGSAPVATMHVARTVARRAERGACSLRDKEGEDAVRPEVMAYLNRLSDWLFVLARWIAHCTSENEVLWTPLGERES